MAVSSYPAIARSRNLSSKRFECNGLISSLESAQLVRFQDVSYNSRL